MLGVDVMDSLATVLSQELIKFNRLLHTMQDSLTDLRRAIGGQIVMSSELDNMYIAFTNSQVPPIWQAVSFASLKGLGSWVKDLVFRVDFFREWLRHGPPAVFALSAFFFPQGFMTGTLQNFARKYQTAIDKLAFEFTVLDHPMAPDEIEKGPEDGVYVYGMWLEGAKWDTQAHQLGQAKPGEMFSVRSSCCCCCC